MLARLLVVALLPLLAAAVPPEALSLVQVQATLLASLRGSSPEVQDTAAAFDAIVAKKSWVEMKQFVLKDLENKGLQITPSGEARANLEGELGAASAAPKNADADVAAKKAAEQRAENELAKAQRKEAKAAKAKVANQEVQEQLQRNESDAIKGIILSTLETKRWNCSAYEGTTSCLWTRWWNCPGQKAGWNGAAEDHGHEAYACCCGEEMWKTMPRITSLAKMHKFGGRYLREFRCEDSAADISDEETCRNAAASLGISFQWSFSSIIGSGCFYRGNDGGYGDHGMLQGAYFVTGPKHYTDTCMQPICSKLCADSFNPGWGNSPEERCGEWASNSDWGALKDGATLEDACKSDWALQSCAATCGCPPPEKVGIIRGSCVGGEDSRVWEKVVYAKPEKNCSVVVSGAGVSAFDGTYEQDGESYGQPRYRKKDTYYTLVYTGNIAQAGVSGNYWSIIEFGSGAATHNGATAEYWAHDETGEKVTDPRQWSRRKYSRYTEAEMDPAPILTEVCKTSTWNGMKVVKRSHECPFDGAGKIRRTKHQGQFVCAGGWCIDEKYLCDGEVNCMDGSDEDNCGE